LVSSSHFDPNMKRRAKCLKEDENQHMGTRPQEVPGHWPGARCRAAHATRPTAGRADACTRHRPACASRHVPWPIGVGRRQPRGSVVP